ALFGSIENTIAAKSEMVKSLPQGGLAIMNWDDENCRKVNVPAGARKITYGFAGDADFRISEGKEGKEGEEGIGGIRKIIKLVPSLSRDWKLEIGGEIIDLNCKLIGRHNIQNLLPAIIVAREAGMEWEEIRAAVENLQPLDNGMKIKEIDGAIIIDDTYNSNPAGVMAALEVLDNIDKKFKVLVLDDIWELGKEGKRIHTELAQKIAKKNYSMTALIGKEYGEMMRDILLGNGVDEERIKTPLSPPLLRGEIKNDSAILFEGRRAGKYINNFKF
ncbi:MAG: Mur ligase family protein, partial [bacterium]